MRASSPAAVLLLAVLLLAGQSACANQPPFDEMEFARGETLISVPDGRTWEVTYEFPSPSTFTGIVRHTSHWSDASVPFMSHDILVTSGDFADPERVRVMVLDHKFLYRYEGSRPQGRIHLLHVLPRDAEVLEQLNHIRAWDEVTLRGREILRIDLFDAAGRSIGYFRDMGCNTILVTQVVLDR